jgi:hypothetical protein
MQPHHVSPRGFQASRAEMNKRRTVEHTDPDGQRLCWPFSFDGLRSPQTNDQTSATGEMPAVSASAPPGPPWSAWCGLPPRIQFRKPAAHRSQRSQPSARGFPPRSSRQAGPGLAHRPPNPPQGFPRVPPPDSPGIGAFRPPNPPTCIVRPKSLHVQAERPSLDSARPFFRRLKTGKRKPPGG